MVTTTANADNYEPTGDSDHAAYGQDFYWTCSCGASARFFTGESKATRRGEQHEDNCPGDVMLRVNK